MPESSQSLHHNVDAYLLTVPGIERRVSRVALGTWAIGGRMWGGTDERAAIATIRGALYQGISVIDTAPAYGFGMAEEIVGRAVGAAGLRSSAVIATKVGLEWRGRTVYPNATRERIMREVEESLRRLRTDHIDIYQVHWPDPLVPIEETAAAMRTLYEQGKIRAIGVSNFSIAQMERFRRVAPLHVLQAPYNLFERTIEADTLRYCCANQIVTFGCGALCRGLLSGRMRPDTIFDGDDLRQLDPKFRPPRYAQYLNGVQHLDRFARDRFERRVIHLAVRWVLDQGIGVALWGARHRDQLRAMLGVSGWSIDAATRREIDRILSAAIADPIGPEFMAPLQRSTSVPTEATA